MTCQTTCAFLSALHTYYCSGGIKTLSTSKYENKDIDMAIDLYKLLLICF